MRWPWWARQPYSIDTHDPVGKRVICAESHWIAHIISKHTALQGREHAVAAAIEHPEVICQSDTHADRQVYYARGLLPAPFDKALLRVVVEYHYGALQGLPATVVTAFPSADRKKGEHVTWPLPSDLPPGL